MHSYEKSKMEETRREYETLATRFQKCCLVLQTLLLFILVYFGTNYLASLRQANRVLAYHWELSIPFIPEFIYIYVSLFFAVFLPFATLEWGAIRRFARKLNLAILLSGTIFLLWPTTLGYTRVAETAQQPVMVELVKVLDLPHNAFPSLHIAVALLLILGLWPAVSQKFRLLLVLWFVLVNLSILFTHQHHVIDILGGVLVALFAHFIVSLRDHRIEV